MKVSEDFYKLIASHPYDEIGICKICGLSKEEIDKLNEGQEK